MLIGYVSDLHCEHTDGNVDIKIPPGIDVLILAGDIHVRPKEARLVIQRLQDKTNAKVLYILGNHEYYHQVFPSIRKRYINQIKKLNNAWLLECNERIIDGVRFLGTTLWSDLANPIDAMNVGYGLNDYKLITTPANKLLNPSDTTKEWERCYKWLKRKLILSKFDGPTIVITHHSPSPITCAPQYATSKIRFGFHSNISNFVIDHGPDVWIYGHDHINGSHQLGKTKLVSNQAGYPHEKLSRIVKTIEVENEFQCSI